MLKDRGNKKWTGLMLTEHRNKLKEIWEHRKDVDMPILDEQKLQELDQILREALENKEVVEVIYYENKRQHHISGTVEWDNNSIIVGMRRILLKNIIDIKVL